VQTPESRILDTRKAREALPKILVYIEDAYGGSSPHPHTPCPIQCVGSVLLCGCIEKQKQRRQQVEFTEEITSPTFQQKCQSCQKHRKNINKIGRECTEILLKNHLISMENGAEMGPGGHLGAKGSQGGKKVPKMVWIWSGFEPFWAPFWDLAASFSEAFFNVFFGGVFFAPWATFGSQRCPKGSQNGAKMEPKGSLGVPSGK